MSLLDSLAANLPTQHGSEVCRAAAKRVALLRKWLSDNQYDGILISRRDNFAWLTCGGENSVLRHTEVGAGHIWITQDDQALYAFTMDAERLINEHMPGQGYTPFIAKWYKDDPKQMAIKTGKGRIAADTPCSGATTVDLSRMHGPMFPLEFDRLRWLGHQTALIFEELVKEIRPGMTEEEIGGRLNSLLVLKGIVPEVIITGSEGRISKYWHAPPTQKVVERYALIHSASMRWGLHACVNRLVCFGAPPPEVSKAHRAAATIEGRVIGKLRTGVAYSDILECQKQWYGELGYPGDWENHFQGGPTGYFLGDAERCFTDMRVSEYEAYDWFITVQGVQVEELTLLESETAEVASLGESWPRLSVAAEGRDVLVPDIYIL